MNLCEKPGGAFKPRGKRLAPPPPRTTKSTKSSIAAMGNRRRRCSRSRVLSVAPEPRRRGVRRFEVHLKPMVLESTVLYVTRYYKKLRNTFQRVLKACFQHTRGRRDVIQPVAPHRLTPLTEYGSSARPRGKGFDDVDAASKLCVRLRGASVN